MKTYKVNKIEKGKLTITGKANSAQWKKAEILKDFSSPWDDQFPVNMVFKSLWDTENLYFCFIVYDDSIYIDKTDNTKSSINNSDRVELFFAKDNNLNPYYCFEIDTESRIMDFIAYPEKNLDFSWSWPQEDICVKSSVEKDKYTVEGLISLQSLKHFGLIENNSIKTGLYRAKYNLEDDGIYKPTWITWINPQTQEPNFHINSSFGNLFLEDDH